MVNTERNALITGSARGIGRGIALNLARKTEDEYSTDAPFTVMVHGRRQSQVSDALIREIEEQGGKAHFLEGDITDPIEVAEMFRRLANVTDRLDLLVNNVGPDISRPFSGYTPDEIQQIISTNLIGPMFVTQQALPFLRKSDYPSIVNIAGRMGREKIVMDEAPYSAAKAGIIQLTKCLALEFGQYGIRVNCISPGLTKTELTEKTFPDRMFWDTQASNNPLGSVGYPDDIANTIRFLASRGADYITGENIAVTGGSTFG